MKNILILSMIVGGLVLACNPPDRDDLAGTGEVRGLLYLHDTLNLQATPSVSSGTKIFLKQATSSIPTDYIQSTTSDNAGNFGFTNLPATGYRISASTTAGGLKFSADTLLSAASASTSVIMYPDVKENNIVLFTVRDTATLGTLKDAKICLFSSRDLAFKSKCEGSSLTLTTDKNGRAYSTAIAPGKYYIFARDSVNPSFDVQIRDSVDIKAATGLFPKTLYLK